MSETEIKEAIALQEEHIKRTRSCEGRVGQAHDWQQYTKSGGQWETWWACSRCKVTKSRADYEARKVPPRS